MDLLRWGDWGLCRAWSMARGTRMVPADRAGPSAPDRSTDPDASRGVPLSEPTIRVQPGAATAAHHHGDQETIVVDLPEVDGYAEAPAIDYTAAE